MSSIEGVFSSVKYQSRFQRPASIELTSETNEDITSIELPDVIKQLITGNEYWVRAKTNRYKKLWREGHSSKLLKLAELAQTKTSPANWFATVCSKKAWERTLDFLTKLEQVAKTAAYVATKLKIQATKFIYKQIWRGVNVVRWADLAADTPHLKTGQTMLKHFAYLCREGTRIYG